MTTTISSPQQLGLKLYEIRPFRWSDFPDGVKTIWIHASSRDKAWGKFCCQHFGAMKPDPAQWVMSEVKSQTEVVQFVKTHAHCKSPGCMEIGTCQPHDEYPHILFCDKHGRRLIIATVKSIVDGTHPDLRE
jgi:hypothetical protein